MFIQEDHTYKDICKRSIEQWLQDMEVHEDVAVRGGVKLCRDYMMQMESQIERLKEENELKNSYLKKMAKK